MELVTDAAESVELQQIAMAVKSSSNAGRKVFIVKAVMRTNILIPLRTSNKEQLNKEQLNKEQLNEEQLNKEQLNKEQLNKEQLNN